MGINRMSTFLHAFISSSGVSVGGVRESNDSDVLSEGCSRYVADIFSAFAAIEKGRRRVLEGRVGEGESLDENPSYRNLFKNSPSVVRY